MRKSVPEVLERGRLRSGVGASNPRDGFYGMFIIQGPKGAELRIVASGGDPNDSYSEGWEHVSVSVANRCPNWPEMCFIKDLFWEETETVVQYHPPKAEWISNHPYCLHLWRNSLHAFPRPPGWMVGIKSVGELRGPDHAAAVRARAEAGHYGEEGPPR